MMDREKKATGKTCTKFDRQIKELIEGTANLQTYPGLQEHILHCPDCAAILRLLTTLRAGLEMDNAKLPAAPRSILQNTLNYMEIKNTANRKKENLWDYISALLRYRIPVYQAIGGLIVILFLSGFLWNSRTLTGKTGMPGFSEGADVQDVYALDTLQAERVDKGQNAREDSILVSFLQYSL
jgi:hypothetical protein